MNSAQWLSRPGTHGGSRRDRCYGSAGRLQRAIMEALVVAWISFLVPLAIFEFALAEELSLLNTLLPGVVFIAMAVSTHYVSRVLSRQLPRMLSWIMCAIAGLVPAVMPLSSSSAFSPRAPERYAPAGARFVAFVPSQTGTALTVASRGRPRH